MPIKNSPQYVEVALFCPLRQSFDYAITPETQEQTNQSLIPGMRIMAPFGHRKQLIGIVLNTKTQTEFNPTRIKPISQILDNQPIISADIFKLCTWASQYYQHPIGEVFAAALPKLLRTGKTLETIGETYYQLSQQAKQLDLTELSRKPAQAKAIAILLEQEQLLFSNSDLIKLKITKSTLSNLIKSGYIIFSKKLALPTSGVTQHKSNPNKLILNPEQQAAVNSVKPNQFHTYLLDGITGSGKTEVYFHIIDKVLAQEKQCLVLIPEISLTPQTISRFQQRFSVPIAALHSGLSDKERLNTWLFAKNNQAKIIIGTRSAIFTPFKNLGLIIIDEEHDSSFKQQEGFRYHARDLAILRAKNNLIPIVLGSATVSIESYYNAIEKKRFSLLTLTQRAGKACVPEFKLIDLNTHKTEHGLTELAIKQIQQHLENQQQVLIFINRRGYAPILFCQSCEWRARCSRCDSYLVWHKQRAQLLCHHCGKQTPAPSRCPECLSVSLAPLGQGTQRLAEHLETTFSDYATVRIDRDNVKNKNQLESQLNIIHQNKPCILIGTQMLAKGHHFPNVTLVIILDIDQGLISPDFRALEKTAQLIMQVAGRAGRAEKPGKVLLQTKQPTHYLFQTLIKKNYQFFLQQLLTERKTCLLPPYGFLALFRAEAKNPTEAFGAARLIKKILEENIQQENTIIIYDAIPAPMQKKAGFIRVQLLIQAQNRSMLQKLLAHCLPLFNQEKLLKNTRWSIDIDPIDVS